jgi:hypothetical protein
MTPSPHTIERHVALHVFVFGGSHCSPLGASMTWSPQAGSRHCPATQMLRGDAAHSVPSFKAVPGSQRWPPSTAAQVSTPLQGAKSSQSLLS